MGNVPWASLIEGDDLFNPRLIGDHFFGNPVDRHRLCADGTVGANQMTHRVDDLPINNVDGGKLNDAPVQVTGFGINNAQHGELPAKTTSVME